MTYHPRQAPTLAVHSGATCAPSGSDDRLIAAAASAARDRSARGRGLADRPIRVKLAFLLIAPVTAIVCLSAVIGFGAQSAATDAERARRLVALSAVAGQLAGELQQERAAAALVLARAAGEATVGAFQRQVARSDAVGDRFEAARSGLEVPAGLQPLLQRLLGQLEGLPLLREQVRSGRDATASVVVFRYRAVIADLLGYRAAMSQLGVDAETADSLRAAAILSQAIEGLGLLQVGALPAIGVGSLSAAQQQQVVANDAAFAQGIETFRQLAPPAWQVRLAGLAGGKSIVAAERLQALVVAGQPNTDLTLDTTPARFASAIGARMRLLHTLERDLDAALVADVTGQRDRQQRQVALVIGGVLAALAVVAALAWGLTRSLTAPLQQLHAGATALAREALPAMVNQLARGTLDETGAQEVVSRAAHAVRVHGRDEVGAVAAAFNDVAQVAARLAGQQAAERGLNVQIVRSLAHRLGGVVNQVTRRLDDLERDEQNPALLELLFAADQEVTGAHRLVNNLLIISGDRPRQSVDDAVPVPQVVKAAIGWADGASTRVRDYRVAADCLIAPHAVDLIVHILAELLANALYFSPGTPVDISSAKVGDQLYLNITDRGIGMPPEKLAEQEQHLTTFDLAAAAKHMGVPVIGLIAADLGLRVTFRPGPDNGGTSVEVVIPAPLLVDDPHRGVPIELGPRTTQTPRTQHHPATLPAPTPTAAIPDKALSAATRPAPPAPLVDSTQELLPVAGRPTPGITPGSPRLVTFETFVNGNPYFSGQPQPGDPKPTLPPAWAAGTAAADRVQQQTAALATPGPERSTRSGLPVRRRGEFLIPPAASGPAAIPAQTNRATTRAGMAALSRAARRLPSSPQQIG